MCKHLKSLLLTIAVAAGFYVNIFMGFIVNLFISQPFEESTGDL